jgi:hypothetical protein
MHQSAIKVIRTLRYHVRDFGGRAPRHKEKLYSALLEQALASNHGSLTVIYVACTIVIQTIGEYMRATCALVGGRQLDHQATRTGYLTDG